MDKIHTLIDIRWLQSPTHQMNSYSRIPKLLMVQYNLVFRKFLFCGRNRLRVDMQSRNRLISHCYFRPNKNCIASSFVIINLTLCAEYFGYECTQLQTQFVKHISVFSPIIFLHCPRFCLINSKWCKIKHTPLGQYYIKIYWQFSSSNQWSKCTTLGWESDWCILI